MNPMQELEACVREAEAILAKAREIDHRIFDAYALMNEARRKLYAAEHAAQPLKVSTVLQAVAFINQHFDSPAELMAVRSRCKLPWSVVDASMDACVDQELVCVDDNVTGYWLTEAGGELLRRETSKQYTPDTGAEYDDLDN